MKSETLQFLNENNLTAKQKEEKKTFSSKWSRAGEEKQTKK